MDHGRAPLLDPTHAAARPTSAASRPPVGPRVSAPAADRPARFRARTVALGAASALAAAGVVTAVLISGPSDDPVGPAGASVAPAVPATTAQDDAEATPCDGGARTFVGGVTITRPGSIETPIAGVEVRTSIKC